MSDKKYAVPEAGLKAAARATTALGGRLDEQDVEPILEAFIRWQSENPQVPTRDEWVKFRSQWKSYEPDGVDVIAFFKNAQRRMYLAPEPEADRIDLYRKMTDGEYKLLCRHCKRNFAGGFFDDTLCGSCYNSREIWDKLEPSVPEELPTCSECHYIQKEGVAIGHAAWCSRSKLSPPSPADLSDLLWQNQSQYSHQPHELNAQHDAAVIEAARWGFERGQKAGTK